MSLKANLVKIFLYIIVIFKYPVTQLCDQRDRWLYLLQESHQVADVPKSCANLLGTDITYSTYESDNWLSQILFNLQFLLNQNQFISFGHHPQYGQVVVKYFNQFENYQWLRFCSEKSRRIPKSDERAENSIQAMQVDLLKFLANYNFKVPKIYEVCGLIVIQSYDGETLSNFYNYPLRDRLQISVNLLKMVLEFTEGVDGFRFYPTDINPDNIVINRTTYEPTLIDLDNTIVIDVSVLSSNSIAKHKIIDCDNCIAFMPDEFCRHPTNDFNLFQMCQILLYDLQGKRENGFLHDLADANEKNLHELIYLLYQCYECKDDDCDNRLGSVIKIINFITDFMATTER